MSSTRDEKGRLLPGVSGNPSGRPRLPDWLKARSEDAVKYICDVATGEEFAEPALRLRAAEWVAERVYGKARQEVEVSAPDESPLLKALVSLAQPAAKE